MIEKALLTALIAAVFAFGAYTLSEHLRRPLCHLAAAGLDPQQTEICR